MRLIGRLSFAVLLASALLACSSSRSAPSTGPRTRPDFIDAEEIRRGQYSSAYDLIRNVRPRWMQSRGPDSIMGPRGEVQVLIDDVRLGGVDRLREVPVIGIVYIQFYDPNTAAGRWGLGYGHGAIYISTRK
jgi:hypothetical protein